MGIAAAIGINVATSSSVASIADGVHLSAGGALTISSTNGTTAGASAVGTAVNSQQENSIAAAVSLNVVSITNHATAGNNVVLSGSSITIAALEPVVNNVSQPDDFRTWSIAGAGGSENSIAGSFGVNVVNFGSNDATHFGTQASIGNNATVTSLGALTVESNNDVTVRNIDGSAALGGENTGIGVSVAVNVARNQTVAYIGSGTQADDKDATMIQSAASIQPGMHGVLPG